ncbi:MAG TPA: type VI secretion system tip protein VgrG [Nannocystis exedens]|nr:type VI secretion system tip protein VgrG [Nannocystis exedens]
MGPSAVFSALFGLFRPFSAFSRKIICSRNAPRERPNGGDAAATIREADIQERKTKNEKRKHMPQSNHLEPACFVLEIEGPEATWAVRSFQADEHLSKPFNIEIDAITKDVGVNPQELLGRGCQLSLERGGKRRQFAGLVIGVEVMARGSEHLGLHLTVGPAFALLRHRQDHRLWQQTSAIDIISEVIEGPLAAHGRSCRWQVDTSVYGPREYCVQHGESDLKLVHRLLAEEGIYYYFEIEEGREVIVFADTSPRAPVIQVLTTDPERRDKGTLSLITDGAGATGEEAISDFLWRRSLVPMATKLRTWSWDAATEPVRELRIEDEAPDPGSREADGDRTVYEVIAPSSLLGDHEERGHRVRHQQRSLAAGHGRGQADAIHLSVGHRFSLIGHPDSKCDRGYFLTHIVHRGDAPEVQLHAHADAPVPRYRADFECIEDDMPFRPKAPKRRTPKLESAIVVGPEGEEIHTDEQGRILVRFHWDRRSHDQASTCWLRVAQSWAGTGFGALFIPRIGHEVVVDYLGGDPDKPLVVGCLYNSLHTPPFKLPDHKATSGMRSDSTPGGGGYHELSFDDTKGRERLHIRAQRDMVEDILHDRTTTVGHERRLEVGKLDTREINGAEIVTVTESASRWVGKNYDVTVAVGNLETSIELGNMTTTIETGTLYTHVMKGDVETEIDHGRYSLSATGQLLLNCTKGILGATAQGDIELISTNGAIRAASQGSNLRLDAETTIEVTAKEQMTLESKNSNVEIRGDKMIFLDARALTSRASENILLDCPGSITLKCGATTIRLDSKGITLEGGQITSTASGRHTISGSTINLN